MKLSLAALIAPAFAMSMLVSAVAHGETPAEHDAHVKALMAAPMACTARPSDSSVNQSIMVCVVKPVSK